MDGLGSSQPNERGGFVTKSDDRGHTPSPQRGPCLPPCADGCVVRLILCRHGETALNALHILQGSGVDPPLNLRGRHQASQLADRLSSLNLDLVVSSGLKRARETAEFVAAQHPGVATDVNLNLAEISWGVYEGQNSPDLTELHAQWAAGNFNYAAPGGETPVTVSLRAEAAIEQIVLRARAMRPSGVAHVVAVAHGRFLRIALSWLLHRSLHFMHTIAHYNCNINIIDVCERIECYALPPRPLSQLSPADLSRISQSLVEQQTQNAYGSHPVPLADTHVAHSEAVTFGSSVGAAWQWGENTLVPSGSAKSLDDGDDAVAIGVSDADDDVFFVVVDGDDVRNDDNGGRDADCAVAVAGDQSKGDIATQTNSRAVPSTRKFLWLVGTLVNDTRHLDALKSSSPSAASS